MKTPDKIKKGLEHCAEDGCKKCPYEDDCNMADGFSVLADDALTLIQRQEADLDTLRKFTVELSARNEELRKEKTTLALRVKQLESERNDLRKGLMNAAGCLECKHFADDTAAELEPPVCKECKGMCNWEWCGLPKEE